MVLFFRVKLFLLLSLFFCLIHVKGISEYALQENIGFNNYSSLESSQCQETDPPLCVKLCFSDGCFSSEFVFTGNDMGRLALQSSRGPSVHNATVAALIDRVQIGKPLLLEVSGIPNLSKENISMVFITFTGNSGPNGLQNVSVMINGYFTCYIDAILPAAGLYHLNVTLINSIYAHSTNWQIRACFSETEYLNLMLSKEDQDVPFCAPLPTHTVGKQQDKASVTPIDKYKRAVWIYSDEQAYATQTDIKFMAVAEGLDPLYFFWRFGDGPEIKTTSRIFKKRYRLPDKYNVTVRVSDGVTSIRSDVYAVVIQRSVQPNRLLYSPSVLSNSSVKFTCRMSSGTDVSYVWNFGEGTERNGSSTEHHVFYSTGEYIIEVIMSNLVSSASLTGHIFVVEELCQPPPVKNMGPHKIQVWRSQHVRLAVTFETQIECNVSKGLLYRWTIYDMSGQKLLLPHIDTGRRYIDLPKYLLHYGTYKAIAKVQVSGNVVYSNYSVLVEVEHSHPVSIISGATNIFINHRNGVNVTLDGRKSHDPDYPNNTLSYSWSCRPVNTQKSGCFTRNIMSTAALLTFPALALKPEFDLLKFTLTVHSGNRSSSSEMFITVISKHISNIHMSCKDCQEHSVNWNAPFTVSAFCEDSDCNTKNVTYRWKLYLVNASSRAAAEVPFCSTMDLGLPSKMEESLHFSRPTVTPNTPALLTESSIPGSLAPYLLSDHIDLTAPVTLDSLTSVKHHDVHSPNSNTNHHAVFPAVMHLPGFFPSFPGETESSGGHRESLSGSDRVSMTDLISDLLYTDNYESLSGDHISDPEYDYYNFGIEEADPGITVGRPTGSDSVGFSWNERSYPDSYDNEGDNLVDSNLLVVSEKTLLDLDKQLIHPNVFESYTLSGLSSSAVTFKPFMLKPKNLYLLEVFASCEQRLRGKSQLFFHTQAVPEGMNCQVQPNTGNEIHTHFSIFCSTGKEDLLYEYSYSVGNTKRKLLYEGRDFQHYFSLPSGDPNHDYKVMVYIEIKNQFGSATKPCPVTVTVLPSFQRNSSSQLNPDQELYLYGVGNLTSLMKTGSNGDIINYIFILTKVLNRLSLDLESSVEFLTLTRTELISAVCQLSTTHKGISYEIIYRLIDLIKIPSQLTFYNVKQIIQHVHKISTVLNGSEPPTDHVNALVSLLSGVLEAPVLFSKPGHQLINKALHTITDLILECMMSSNISQYNLSTTFMELLAWTDDESHSTVKTFGLTAFHFTDFLEMQFQQWRINSQQKPCVITLLTVYSQSPYRSSRDMQFSGETADIRLYNCTTRKEIKVRHLSPPVTVEFQRKEETKHSKQTDFTLERSEVNIHEFNITSETLQRAFQITVHFTRPAERPFPILLLLRMYEQPTPNLYNKQKIYHWKGKTAHFFLPQSYLHATGTVYLMLLKADYNKSPSNKYITRAVNYTVRIESVECLSWDGARQWKPDGCFPLAAVYPDKIYCSCNHLASFAVSHESITNNYSSADVSQFIHSKPNYIPVILAVIFLALHIMASVICRKADVSLQKTTGSFLLPENNPSDRFLYAVTIDTGFRSRTRMTAKVYIVLHGDEGVSQTREVSSSDSRLFTNNSRNTFILSSPESLGQVWKVHLWHDNGGSSPSWYLSHVVVKDLVQGSCWFFLGQCWLAVDEGDGRVERNLVASEGGLTFKQLLYLKLTEYLEDFHPWFSVYSRPSSSSHTHTQRLSVCLLLLQGYMCVNTLLINLLEEQCFAETGLIDVPAVSMLTGVCSALAVMPAGGLVSLVFRVSKTKSSSVSGEQYKLKVSDVCSVEEHHDAFLMNNRASESCLSWNSVSCSCKKEYKDCITSDSVSASKLQDDPDTILEIVDDYISDVNKRSHGKRKWKKSNCKSHFSAEVLKNQQFCDGTIQSLGAWCRYLGWTLCVSLCLTCVTITGSLGLKFNKTETQLWAHSVFFSLICGGFVLHPAMILITAITVSLKHRKRSDWFHSLSVTEPVFELLRHRGQKSDVFGSKCQQFTERSTHFEKVLADRQRARFLRLVRPPNSKDLKLVRGQIKKQTLLYKTTRDLMLHLIMLWMIIFVAYGKSDSDSKYRLNQAIKTHFTKSLQNSFHSIQKHDDWWNWTTTSLLEKLYNNADNQDERQEHDTGAAFSLIGSPVITKIKSTHNSSCQILNLLSNDKNNCFDNQSATKKLAPFCGKLGCYKGERVYVSLGKTRLNAFTSVKRLLETGWMTPFTQIVILQFVLYNGPSNLFTSVTILVEKTSTGALLPSASVQSTRLYYFPTALDYSVMICEHLFLVFILFHMYWQIYIMTQRGCMVYWRSLWSWLEVTVIICSLLLYICSMYKLQLKTEVIDFLKKEDFKLLVDLSSIFFCEQLSQSLLGIVVNLLLLKCLLLLRLNKTVAAAVVTWKLIFSNLIWLLAPGVIIALALSNLCNLILHSVPFTSLTRLLFTRFLYIIDIHLQSHVPPTFFGGLVFFTMIPVKAVLIATLAIFVKQAKNKSKKRKDLLSVFELTSYVKALFTIKKANHKSTDHQDHANSFYLAEFEDLMDELMFHLCAMSDNLPAKENLFEIQSNFSISLSDVHDGSDSECVDGTYMTSQLHKKKHKVFLDGSNGSLLSHKEHIHRLSQYSQGTGRIQKENLPRPQRFRKHLRVRVRDSEEIGQEQMLSSSKQSYCAPAEWKSIMSSKSSTQPDPRSMADKHNNALNTQVINEIKRCTIISCPQVNMGHVGHGKEAGQSYMCSSLPIEGMDDSIGQHTIIPRYIDQCM